VVICGKISGSKISCGQRKGRLLTGYNRPFRAKELVKKVAAGCVTGIEPLRSCPTPADLAGAYTTAGIEGIFQRYFEKIHLISGPPAHVLIEGVKSFVHGN
jgi:hypothetical protein